MSDSETERCREAERFRKIDAAFRLGDLAALREAVAGPDSIPNGPMPLAIGACLEYAVYHSPVGFIRTLLELGADPNPKDHAGFPPLIAALSCHQAAPGSKARNDVAEIVALLLSFGADPDQRGINDFTALHMAVAVNHPDVVRLLLGTGANPHLRTRIDDYDTPREYAEKAQRRDIAALLASAERSFIQR
jgi:uncharacterized protein